MPTALKRRPRRVEKGNTEESGVVDQLRQAVDKINDRGPENTREVKAETTETSVTNEKVPTGQNDKLGENFEGRKPNPDFEPEFDGDLEHVSWVPMKLFGHQKGF